MPPSSRCPDAHGATTSTGIRVATITDSAEIGAVHCRAFRETYRGLVPSDTLERIDEAAWSDRWEERLALAPGDDHFVLAGIDASGSVRGFVSGGGSRDDDGKGNGELYALYVTPEATRKGIGTALVHVALGRLSEAGFARTTLWVARGNGAARAFYLQLGFVEEAAEKVVYLEGTAIEALRIGRSLL